MALPPPNTPGPYGYGGTVRPEPPGFGPPDTQSRVGAPASSESRRTAAAAARALAALSASNRLTTDVDAGADIAGRDARAVAAGINDRGEAVAIATGAVTVAAFAAGLKPVELLAALPPATGSGRIVFLTTDNRLYRDEAAGRWVALSSGVVAGSVDLAAFANGIRPVEVVAVLPPPGQAGRVALLTTDGKLYRDTGTAWTAAVPAADVTGQLTTGQLAAGAVTADTLAANSVILGKVAAGAINAGAIAALAVTAAALAADSVTAGKIAAGAVRARELAADEITGDKIKAGALGAREIAAGSITASRISVVDLTDISPRLGGLAANTVAAGGGRAAATIDAAGNYLGNVAGQVGGYAAGSVAVAADRALNGLDNIGVALKPYAAGLVGQIVGTQITPGGITTPLLAANAITADKLAGGQIAGLNGTSGVNFVGVRPGAWSAFLDFTATGSQPFLQSVAPDGTVGFTLYANGQVYINPAFVPGAPPPLFANVAAAHQNSSVVRTTFGFGATAPAGLTVRAVGKMTSPPGAAVELGVVGSGFTWDTGVDYRANGTGYASGRIVLSAYDGSILRGSIDVGFGIPITGPGQAV